MSHVIIEYITNVKVDTRIPEPIRVLNDVLVGHADVFPIGGIRTRVLCLGQYRMAGGAEDDAFIHVTFRIKTGRRGAVTGPICAAMFAAMCTYLTDVFARHYLGLTLELVGFGARGFHVESNVHACFACAAESQ